MIQEMSFYDPWVQDMLWVHMSPQDIHYRMTRLQAMNYLEQTFNSGDMYYLGDPSKHVLIRVVVRNPFVVEPHIMGNGRRLREATLEAIPIGFAKGAESIINYTQYDQLRRIYERIGFTHVATIPKSHFQDGKPVDIHVLTLTKEAYERNQSPAEHGDAGAA